MPSGDWLRQVRDDQLRTGMVFLLATGTLLVTQSGDEAQKKNSKHVRVDERVTSSGRVAPPSPSGQAEKRVVTMEPSVRSFAGPSATRRDRSDPVMITDALADVRVK